MGAGSQEMSTRPKRQCRERPAPTTQSLAPVIQLRGTTPRGRVLIIHANGRSYGKGAVSDKNLKGAYAHAAASNRNEFSFAAADYEQMRDSWRPYSGDPKVNKLLPLPRPTYTEFVIRARKAKVLDKLDFLYCRAEAAKPPKMDFSAYERVIWSGVTFRRFARIWTPERTHFFSAEFQRRALTVLCCAWRHQKEARHLGMLSKDVLLTIIAETATKADSHRDSYDDLQAVCDRRLQHLFLPAPGSSADRDAVFDAVFGL